MASLEGGDHDEEKENDKREDDEKVWVEADKHVYAYEGERVRGFLPCKETDHSILEGEYYANSAPRQLWQTPAEGTEVFLICLQNRQPRPDSRKHGIFRKGRQPVNKTIRLSVRIHRSLFLKSPWLPLSQGRKAVSNSQTVEFSCKQRDRCVLHEQNGQNDR
jgi:hypothetical protein